MIDSKNLYTQMQRNFYSGGTSNHLEHNDNQDYWNILLSPIKKDVSTVMDFGCGKGRNIENIIKVKNDVVCTGVDISEANINHCKTTFKPPHRFILNNGVDIGEVEDSSQDVIISTIVLQHIPVWDIRYNILKEFHRLLRNKARLSFQMGYNDGISKNIPYNANHYSATGTNGMCDVEVSNVDQLKDDLVKIGFEDIQTYITKSYSDDSHPSWIYVNCGKK